MLQTKRTSIIILEKKHLKELRKLRNLPSTWHWLTDINPINEIQQERWFEKLCLDNSKKYFAIEDRRIDKFIGILRSDEWDRTNSSVRIGGDIIPEYRRKGYAFEVLTDFIMYLFTHQNINRVWLWVAEENAGAIGLYKKLGFLEEGRMREALYRDCRYIDYISMSILRKEL